MKSIKQIKYDIAYGIYRNKILIWMPILLSVIYFFNFCMKVGGVNEYSHILYHPTFADLFFYGYGGDFEFVFGEDISFAPPIAWLLLWAMCFFSILRYPVENLHHHGQQLLLKTSSRKSWYLSKVIIIFLSYIYYHGIYIGGLFVLNSLYSRFPMKGQIDIDLYSIIMSIDQLYLFREGEIHISYVGIATMFVVGMCICLAQLFLSLVLKPMYTYLGILSFLIGASFLRWYPLFSNYLLLIRLDFIQEGGLNSGIGLMTGVIGIIIFILLGQLYFLKYDILPKE